MKKIPLSATPSQTLAVTLGGQNCAINVYEKSTGVFLDLILEGVLVAATVPCLDRVRIINRAYLGFVGDLVFFDLQGKTNPAHGGFGTRYMLAYIE